MLGQQKASRNKYFILRDFLCNIYSEFTIFANIGVGDTM